MQCFYYHDIHTNIIEVIFFQQFFLGVQIIMVLVPKLLCIWCVITMMFIQKVTGVYFLQLFSFRSKLSWCLCLSYQGCHAEITVLFTHKLPGDVSIIFSPPVEVTMTFVRKLLGPGSQITMSFAQKLPGHVSTQKSLMWSCHDIYNEATWVRCTTRWYMGDYKTTWEIQKKQEEKCFFWLIWKWKKRLTVIFLLIGRQSSQGELVSTLLLHRRGRGLAYGVVSDLSKRYERSEVTNSYVYIHPCIVHIV
jgi:hypothetical protein